MLIIVEEILECTNLEWVDIVTLVNADELDRLLKQSAYDKQKRCNLVNGFKCGFNLGYQGAENHQDLSANIPIKPGVRSLTEMWNKVMKEVQAERYAGPFEFQELPFTNFVQSPIGLVPKAGNKTCLIFHQSNDFDGDNDRRKSINFHTPQELCSVKYNDLDHAILNSLHILKETKGKYTQVVYAKSDCSNAFRILSIKICFCLQIFVAKSATSKNNENVLFH